MPYATPTDLMTFVDARLIGDLCEDAGNRLTPTQILADPNVAAALSAAAGTINAAVLVGARYTVAQLEAVTGDDAVFIQMLNSWLAFGVLCGRRGRDPKEQPEYVQSLETLEQIKKGAEMFNVGPGQNQVPQTNFISAANYQAVGTLRARTPELFPVRRLQQASGG